MLEITAIPMQGNEDDDRVILACKGLMAAIVGSVNAVTFPDYLQEEGARDFYFLHIMGEDVCNLRFETIRDAMAWVRRYRPDEIAACLDGLKPDSMVSGRQEP